MKYIPPKNDEFLELAFPHYEALKSLCINPFGKRLKKKE
jgi:hypothetical protein